MAKGNFMRRQTTLRAWQLGMPALLFAAASLAPAQAPPPPAEAPAANADLDSLLASADASLNGSQWDEAIDKYTQALQTQPYNSRILNARGWAWQEKGEIDRAILDYNAAISSDPQFVLAITNRGYAYRQKGDVTRATQDATNALRLNPLDAGAHALRGDLAFDKSDYRGALDAYAQAIHLKPQDDRQGMANLYASSANASLQLGDLKAAINGCFIAIEWDSVNELAWIVEGTVYNKQGNFTGALAAWLAALNGNANSAETLNNLAWLQATCDDAQCRNGQSAVQYATRACELTEYKNADYLDTLAAAYAEMGDFENAITWEYGAIELATDDKDKADMRKHAALYESHQPYRDVDRTGE